MRDGVVFDEKGCRPAEFARRFDTAKSLSRDGRRALVIGAGLTGLTAAWRLALRGTEVSVVEAESFVGGMSTTFSHGDFLLDLGPHKFYSVMDERMRLAEEIMGEEFLTVEKRSRIRLAGRFLNYPLGMIDMARNLDPFIAVSGGLSYMVQLLKNLFDQHPAVSYEDWLVRLFGRKLYEVIFAEYAWKIWGDPRSLSRELAATRVAVPGLLPLVWKMIWSRRNPGQAIHAESFRYPRWGSGHFACRLADLVVQNGGEIRYNSRVSAVNVEDGKVRAIQIGPNEEISLGAEDAVVTTIPIPSLMGILRPQPTHDVCVAARDLKARDLVLVYVIVDRSSVSPDSWLFFPERKYVFNRVFEQRNFSSAMCPEGKTALCAEIVVKDEACGDGQDAEVKEKTLLGLSECGLVRKTDTVELFTKQLRMAYPIYDVHYKRNLDRVLTYLDGISNLYSVGRQGGFNYVGQIDCLDIGVITADHILRKDQKRTWGEARTRFGSYIVLD